MKKTVATALFALLLPGSPSAATIVVPHYDRGAYQDSGRRIGEYQTIGFSQSTFTGVSRFGTYRSFFVFDLTNVPTIQSATLRLELEKYLSPYAPSEAFSLFDVSTPTYQLLADYNTSTPQGKAIYNDLGTGNIYAYAVEVTFADQGTVLEIPLSAQAVADINAAAGGTFAIGCRLHSSVFPRAIRFSEASEYRQHELVLEEGAPARRPLPAETTSWTRVKALYR